MSIRFRMVVKSVGGSHRANYTPSLSLSLSLSSCSADVVLLYVHGKQLQ